MNIEYYLGGRETNNTSSVANFMVKILADDEIAEVTNLLNSKQREPFNVAPTCAKNYGKMMGVMLNQYTNFFQVMKPQVILIW